MGPNRQPASCDDDETLYTKQGDTIQICLAGIAEAEKPESINVHYSNGSGLGIRNHPRCLFLA